MIRRTIKAAVFFGLILFASALLAVETPAGEIAGDGTETIETEAQSSVNITTSDADLNTDISIRRNLSERRKMMIAAAVVLAASILILILLRRIERNRYKETDQHSHRNGGTDE